MNYSIHTLVTILRLVVSLHQRVSIYRIINYTSGLVSVNPIYITTVSNVDNSISSAIRLTATPSSSDIVGQRNQIVEIDLVNTTISGGQDTIAVNSAGGSTGYVTTTNYTTPSSY